MRVEKRIATAAVIRVGLGVRGAENWLALVKV